MKVELAVAALTALMAWGTAGAGTASQAGTIAKIGSKRKIVARDSFYGYDRVKFDFCGRIGWVVFPKGKEAAGRPWTWTMMWPDAFVERTGALEGLKRGWHHVHLEAFDTRMADQYVRVFADFQRFLVDELGFAPKANLIGMSWGGFYSTRYAVSHPDLVSRIYLDAPLLDFASFAGRENRDSWIGPWSAALPPKGWNGWSADPRMPVNLAEKLAKTGIPVLLLYGSEDATCPPQLNAELFVRRFKAAGGVLAGCECRKQGHHPHGYAPEEAWRIYAFFAKGVQTAAAPVVKPRPVPNRMLRARIDGGVEIIGIVHWGLNTFTDREWGYGDEDPKMLNPSAFDADQIVGAAKAGGIQGLVFVAKHHDGFCLWPTKTTEHNITKSPFRGGKGDYVKEMCEACRRAGVRFGVYCSPWDRNNADYGTPKYVETYHAQIRELLGGAYGEIFEMWFDGANGGDGYYGGARETRKIPGDYYRFDKVFRFVRELQPNVCIFGMGGEFDWPGNEQGLVDPDRRAGDAQTFRMWEADFPLRPGWFYHEKERGRVRHGAFLMKVYLSSVGHGGIMDIGLAPDRRGLLDDEDVTALRNFRTIKDAFFAKEITGDGEPFNVVVLCENLDNGAQVDGWEYLADGKAILSGRLIGAKQIRVLENPVTAAKAELRITADGGRLLPVTVRRYLADPELVKLVLSATSANGETDTAKWMTGREREKR